MIMLIFAGVLTAAGGGSIACELTRVPRPERPTGWTVLAALLLTGAVVSLLIAGPTLARLL